ncbi:hypothetical protein BKA82DRAFT_3974066, partial [Pisolithus tinctorius]
LQMVDLTVCPCAPAALQLLQMGYFPSAPLGPTLAVSLQLLSLVWLLQCWNHCQEKKTSAKKGLRKSGINIQTLQAEWEAQVSVQTKPASHKLPV